MSYGSEEIESGEHKRQRRNELYYCIPATCWAVSHLLSYSIYKKTVLLFISQIWKMYGKLSRHCLLMPGRCASRKQTSIDTQGFSSSLPVATESLTCFLWWWSIPVQSCWHICSSPQWCPAAIRAPHPMPRCPGTAILSEQSCVTVAPARGLCSEMPPVCVGWMDTGLAPSPTAQVRSLAWGRRVPWNTWLVGDGWVPKVWVWQMDRREANLLDPHLNLHRQRAQLWEVPTRLQPLVVWAQLHPLGLLWPNPYSQEITKLGRMQACEVPLWPESCPDICCHRFLGRVQASLLLGPDPNPLLCSFFPCLGLQSPSLLPLLSYHCLSNMSYVKAA